MKRLFGSLILITFFVVGVMGQGPPQTPQPGVPFDVELGNPVAVTPGERVELVTPSGISIGVTPGESIEITITESTTNPTGSNPTDGTALDIFITIETNETDPDIDAEISIPYGERSDQVGNPANLNLAFYNESTERWEMVSSTVDENAQVATAKVDHFSTWTLIEADSSFSLPFNGFSLLVAILALPLLRKTKSDTN